MADLILGPGAASVKRMDAEAMLMFRGDLAAASITRQLHKACQIPCPEMGQIVHADGGSMAWMSPDESLIFLALADADRVAESIRSAFSGQHALCVDVSSMRVMFEIAGPGTRDILARGTPADVSSEALPIGCFRRSQIGQAQAAFWFLDPDTARIVCRRSEAGYLHDWLGRASSFAGPGFYKVSEGS